MPVEPDLPRPWAVGAELDEPDPELGIEDVEVVDADPAVLLEELEVRPRAWLLATVATGEHPLELLALNDRHDPEAALPLGRLQVRAHVIELAITPVAAIALGELEDRDLALCGEPLDGGAEAVPDRRQQRR